MPLMPEYFLDSLVFIYTSAANAKKDVGFVGAGFIVGKPSAQHPSFHMHYVVTAYHILEEFKDVALRLNVEGGGFRAFTVPFKAWTVDRKVDLAVLPVGLKNLSFSYVSTEKFVDLQKIKRYKVGAGDEVCLVGRVQRKGIRYLNRNIAMLRFGNIALMPQHEETMYIVELRSISGHSGSPVIVYCLPYALAGTRQREHMWSGLSSPRIKQGSSARVRGTSEPEGPKN